MEYINVSQFYESILCFSLPLLIIQRLLLCCCDLSTRYQDYRAMFYEDEFKFTREYDHAPDEPPKPLPEPALRDAIMDTRDQSDDQPRAENDMDAGQVHENDQENRSRIESFSRTGDFMESPVKRPGKKNSVDLRPKNKIEIDLETDRELRNSSSTPVLNKQKEEESEAGQPKMRKKSTEGKEEISQSQSQHPHKTEPNNVEKKPTINQEPKEKISVEEIEQSRMSHHTEVEVRRETQLDEDMERGETAQQEQQGQDKQVIELGRGELLEQGERDKLRLKYCRRVDDAFNDYVPVIMSVVVLGILTHSVYILSMCCFFGYAFSSLLFNYVHLLDLLEGPSKDTFFGKANQLISSLFIIGLFISYWASTEFY